MKQQLAQAVKYWDYIAPIMKYPSNKKEFNILVDELDELLEIVGDDENHRLIGLVDAISNLISSYEEAHQKSTAKKGIDALKFLMETHHLSQSDLTEIGSQGVVSEILNGKRSLNLRQIKSLAQRFHVEPATFIDD
jgi:HTH-type transcriptional regulator/antitoxin HigA